MAQRRAALLATVLHHHHRAEDTLLFPALRERQPGVATTTVELEAQHDELDTALGTLPSDLTYGGRGPPARRASPRRRGAPGPADLVGVLHRLTSTIASPPPCADRRRCRDAGLMISWLLDTAPDGAFDVAYDQVPHHCA